MTVINVPGGVEDWQKPQGDPAGIETLGDSVYRGSAAYDELDELAAIKVNKGMWAGTASEAVDRTTTDFGKIAAAMSAAAVRVGRAVTAYSEELTALQQRDEELRGTKAFLDTRRRRLISVINSTKDAEQWMIDGFVDRAKTLTGEYHDLQADVDALLADVKAQNAALIGELRAASTRRGILEGRDPIGDVAATKLLEGGIPLFSSPADAARWWKGLTPAEQQAIMMTSPGVLGAMDGLPADVRDQANRLLLDQDTDVLGQRDKDGTMSSDDEKTWKNVQAANTALGTADNYIDPIDGTKPGGFLYMYDPKAFGGDGKIAVAVGNPDTAANVAVRVPGITTDMAGSQGLMNDALNVYESARFNGSNGSVSSMMWLGYDAPDGITDTATLGEARAIDGGNRLADTLDGMTAAHGGTDQHLTVIGHSYGSTTVAHAATDHHLDVDDYVLVGSPGAGSADNASDLGVDDDHVFVGANSRDPVADLGNRGWVNLGAAGLGNDPSEDDFDATRFRAEDPTRTPTFNPGGLLGDLQNTVDPLHISNGVNMALGLGDHSKYFNPNTESLYNIGRVVGGDPSGVITAGHVHDPWYGGPTDPENWRDPTSPHTGRNIGGSQ